MTKWLAESEHFQVRTRFCSQKALLTNLFRWDLYKSRYHRAEFKYNVANKNIAVCWWWWWYVAVANSNRIDLGIISTCRREWALGAVNRQRGNYVGPLVAVLDEPLYVTSLHVQSSSHLHNTRLLWSNQFVVCNTIPTTNITLYKRFQLYWNGYYGFSFY